MFNNGTFLGEIATQLRDTNVDVRLGHFFYQRVSLILVRGNVISVLGSMLDENGFWDGDCSLYDFSAEA